MNKNRKYSKRKIELTLPVYGISYTNKQKIVNYKTYSRILIEALKKEIQKEAIVVNEKLKSYDIGIDIEFFYKNCGCRVVPDIDNSCKTILDLLQRCEFFYDDGQVIKLTANKYQGAPVDCIGITISYFKN